jgi:hypothetical protein
MTKKSSLPVIYFRGGFQVMDLCSTGFIGRFFVLGFAMITCGHQFIYGVQQIRFELCLLTHCIKRITDIEQYNSANDCELLKNKDFQNEVENRLKVCVKRHIEMLQ